METNKAHILIVDDIGENLQVLGNILNKEGFDTSFALNGKQALSIIEDTLPDLVLLDISMPLMNGFEVCSILKNDEKTKSIPIIFLTARTEVDSMVYGFTIGADDYVTKPFNTLELLARVRAHIDLKRFKDTILIQNKKLSDLVEQLSKSNEELNKLIASKDKFFSIIAHDLKGPIGNLNSFLIFMGDHADKLSKEDLHKNILSLQNSSKKIQDLLENLLTWARSQKGDIEYKPDKFNLKRLIQSNMLLFESAAKNKKISISCDVDEGVSAYFDYEMIKTVFRNLINNAIKYTNENGSILIYYKELDQKIEISIKDSGIGMDKSISENLFRIDVKHFSTNGTKGEKGTGLGLILCKEFIDKHNGEIWVESKEGTGSEFKFTLPKCH